MENSNKKHFIFIYSLLIILILLVAYGIFRNPINDFLRKESIIRKASMVDTQIFRELLLKCSIEIGKGGSREFVYDTKECKELGELEGLTKKGYDEFIRKHSDIDCLDFDTIEFANEFFRYVGKYDPYNLDSDKDGVPCNIVKDLDSKG